METAKVIADARRAEIGLKIAAVERAASVYNAAVETYADALAERTDA